MNHQNKFLLPDKSIWKALTREQREALSSKYTILCPIILFTEFARHGLSPCNPWLDLENMIVVHHWSERAKMDLLTQASARPMSLGSATPIKSILESTEQELLAFSEVSGENIEMLIECEAFYRNLHSIIHGMKNDFLSLDRNTDNLSDEEWVCRLKIVLREHQAYYPAIERILKRMDAEGCRKEGIQPLQTFIKTILDTYNADTLENAYQLAVHLFDHDPSDHGAAHEILQRLCGLFSPTQEEHTQIFNRFLNEDMPPISRFAPYALSAVIWNYTIQFYLREDPKEPPPTGDFLRDAEYLLYTYHKGITFVSGDKWHRKFVNEVPLFEGVRENFVFVDTRTKEGLSKLL